MEPALDEFVRLVRRVGFTGLLELLKSAEQELAPQPSYPPHLDLTEQGEDVRVRLTETDDVTADSVELWAQEGEVGGR